MPLAKSKFLIDDATIAGVDEVLEYGFEIREAEVPMVAYIQIGGEWKKVSEMQIQIGEKWKSVVELKINVLGLNQEVKWKY